MDFISGASSFDAVSKSMSNGWGMKCLSHLHAKIYCMDRKLIFVGSANFTARGLKIYGEGNLESSTEAECSEENLQFIDRLFKEAIEITPAKLEEMQKFVGKSPVNQENMPNRWPEGMFNESASIWVYDFPWFPPDTLDFDAKQHKHDVELFLGNEKDGVGDRFRATKSFRWLVDQLNLDPSNGLYFGTLSSKLHNDLQDDPAPYRKDVKGLLSNLLKFCSIHATNVLQIDRPNYSERVRLIE